MSGAAFNEAAPVSVSAATTTDISSSASNIINVTGGSPITITSWGSLANGALRKIRFTGAGAHVIQQNGNTNNLTGADITVAQNDFAIIRGLGSGVCIMEAYQRYDGTALAGIATQAQMEAGSSTVVGVTPGRQPYHPLMPKAWAYIPAAGTSVTAGASVGGATQSCAHNGTGNYTWTHGLTFSSTNYAVLITAERGAGLEAKAKVVSRTTTTVTYETYDGGSINDYAHHIVIFGDLP
jgi:hypothetical protein